MTKKEFIRRLRDAGVKRGTSARWNDYEAGKKLITESEGPPNGNNILKYNRYIKWLCEYVGV